MQTRAPTQPAPVPPASIPLLSLDYPCLMPLPAMRGTATVMRSGASACSMHAGACVDEPTAPAPQVEAKGRGLDTPGYF